jgi:hypothetical protein
VSTWNYTNTSSQVIEVNFSRGSGAFVPPGVTLVFNDWEGGHMQILDVETRTIRQSGKVEDIAEPGNI